MKATTTLMLGATLRVKVARRFLSHSLILLAATLAGCGDDRAPQQEPPGREETAKTDTLELGATLLQTTAPLDPINVYLVGFHPMKNEPDHQMEAHHFCNQVNQDFAQCVLFDGNTRDANMNGVEYIISEKLFATLPAEERQYWHPHNYEILSGQLVGPGLPDVAETELMREKMNSYGKTWHFWRTGMAGQPGDALPLGEPQLAWSLNRDGEATPGLLEQRDEKLGINSAEKRRQRQALATLAHPQQGVDALKDQFGRETTAVPGVEAKPVQQQPTSAETQPE